jgi:Reverse transcriptase (RNA-dependent DNA polymerase)
MSQIDIKNAFLQGTLEEDIYMTLPPRYENDSNKDLVCKLNKSIFGLKQSPREWYGKFNHSLLSHNFVKSSADSSMFVQHSSDTIVIVLVYVDDIIITWNNEKKIKNVKDYLKNKFDIKDLKKLKYFLGIEIAYSKGKDLFLSQRKYVLDLLKETGKLDAKPANTPMKPNKKLYLEEGELLKDRTISKTCW